MVPNPYWFGGTPGLKRVTYRIIPSENTLLIALRTHEIDFYYSAPEQQYRELRAKKVSVPKFFRSSGCLFSHREFDPFGQVRTCHFVSSIPDPSPLRRSVQSPIWF